MKITSFEGYFAVFIFDDEAALDDVNELIFVVMFVPGGLVLRLGDLDVSTVDPTDELRRSMLLNHLQFAPWIDDVQHG